MTQLHSKIEALLFYFGTEVAFEKLAELTGETVEHVREALVALSERYKDSGVCLQVSDAGARFTTAPALTDFFTDVAKSEKIQDIGKAGLEVLSILIYRGPSKRAEIDYIRGVNSQSIVRTLLIRKLIERDKESSDRSPTYRVTLETLSHLGAASREVVAEYERLHTAITAIESATDSPQHTS
jgi:segregation and condensation protein B